MIHRALSRVLSLLTLAIGPWASSVAAAPAPTAETGPRLVLHLGESRLRMVHGGALLREYEVAAVEEGRPATLFVPRRLARPAHGQAWALDRVEPVPRFNRPIVIPAAPGSHLATVEIPPPPEEAIPVPGRFLLRFDDGLTVEIVADGPTTEPFWSSWFRAARWRLRDVGQALSPRPENRIRLVMPLEEAGALYRSLPPSIELFVVG